MYLGFKQDDKIQLTPKEFLLFCDYTVKEQELIQRIALVWVRIMVDRVRLLRLVRVKSLGSLTLRIPHGL